MIDITHKITSLRVATAQATVTVSKPETIKAVKEKTVPKGDVFAMCKAADLKMVLLQQMKPNMKRKLETLEKVAAAAELLLLEQPCRFLLGAAGLERSIDVAAAVAAALVEAAHHLAC